MCFWRVSINLLGFSFQPIAIRKKNLRERDVRRKRLVKSRQFACGTRLRLLVRHLTLHMYAHLWFKRPNSWKDSDVRIVKHAAKHAFFTQSQWCQLKICKSCQTILLGLFVSDVWKPMVLLQFTNFLRLHEVRILENIWQNIHKLTSGCCKNGPQQQKKLIL